MKQLLSPQAYQEINEHGYFKPGIKLDQSYITQAREVFASYTETDSNFGYHYSNTIDNYSKPTSLSDGVKKFFNRNFPVILAKKYRTNIYSKCVFDTSPFMSVFMQACINRGLTDAFADKDILLSHDILFESGPQDNMFGFHYDPFSWDVFYQSGDDLTIYMPLQDLNEHSGGRLLVEKNAHAIDNFATRNSDIYDFYETCVRYVEPNEYGLISREALQNNKVADHIAPAYQALLTARLRKTPPQLSEMSVINAQAGEVFIFNNKNFHATEPWKLNSKRQNYSIRTMPLYDFGLQPPDIFLDNRKCNRFVLDMKQLCLKEFNAKQTRESVYYSWS